MGECAHEDRDHDEEKASEAPKLKFVEVIGQSALDGVWQEHAGRTLHEVVKHPQDDQCNGKRKDEKATESVAVAVHWDEEKKIFEVRGESTDHKGRGDKRKTPKGQRGSRVREREWHFSII